jgi:osmotically-inducible protein OsmY
MDQAVLEPERRERVTGHGANAYSSQGAYRADRALQSRIQSALEASGYDQLRNLGVLVDAGEVILRGRLPSYYLTQLALTKAMRVEGVARVRNEIQVSNQLN